MFQMSYNSAGFLIFFGAFLLLYVLMPRVWLRQAVILAGNIVFYLFAGGKSLLAVLFATTVVVYAVSVLMGKVYEGFEAETAEMKPKERMQILPGYRKKAVRYLIAGIVIVLGILLYGKIGRLAGLPEVVSFDGLRRRGMMAVLVPVGVSYYTFSAVGYLLDVYWRKAKAERNYFLLLISMTYFPIIVQGPISRYDRLMKQMKELPGFSYERVTLGLQRMVWGLFKKLVIADRLSMYTGTIFADIGSYAGVEVILAVAANVMHIYMDFSGCMDIVIGAAEAMGVTLDENFRQPFFSKGAAEFWRRWHITLGTWFKDYVYMPIATSKGMMKKTAELKKSRGKRISSFAQTAIPLIVVWVLTGLWHGTGPDYLIWGLYWGVLIIVESTFAPEFRKVTEFFRVDPESYGHRLFQMVRTFVYFAIGRMITALGNAGSFVTIMRSITREARPWVLFDGTILGYGIDAQDMGVLLIAIAVVWIVSILQTKMNVREALAKQPLVLRWIVYLAGIIAVVVFGIYGPGYTASAFVYGAF